MERKPVRRKTNISENDATEKGGARLSRPMPYQPIQDNKKDGVFTATVLAAHAVGLTAVGLIIWWVDKLGGFAWTSDANQQFFWHPLLMVLGLVYFYGNSIIVYRTFSFLPKLPLKVLHGALHLAAIICSSLGLVAVFENHRRTNKADLYSLHSWIGIGTFGFFCLQYVSGFVTFLFPGLPVAWRAKMMPYHVFFGLGLFVMAIASAEMGLTERLLWTGGYTEGKFPVAGILGNVIGLLLVVFAFLVFFIATRATYKRKETLTIN